MKSAVCLCLCGFFLWAAEPAKEVFERAARALAARDYEAAERGFQDVLRAEPRNVAALSNLGVLYSRTNRPDRAIASYRRALQASPNDEAVLLNLGLVYLRQEAHARALPLFARILAKNPQHLQARKLRAVCLAYTGQLQPAIRELEALSASAPRDEEILFLLGFAYLKNGKPEQARPVFDRMLEEAGPARAQLMIGKAYYEATLFPQAEESFLAALRAAPELPGVRVELGKVYISLRRNEDAMRELEAALRANPGDVDATYFVGGMLAQDGRYSDAIPYLERAKQYNPGFWAPYFYLGKARLKLEQPVEAVKLLRRAAELNPDEASVYYQLGRALEACGRSAEAGRALRRVRELRAAALNAQTLDDTKVVGAR